MRLLSATMKLQEDPFLHALSLNDVSQYARPVGHLQNDILLPQTIHQSNPCVPPDVLSGATEACEVGDGGSAVTAGRGFNFGNI